MLVLAGLTVGCGDAGGDGDNGGRTIVEDGGKYSVEVDPADFVDGIDNPYLPYRPGTAWVYEGETDEGRERIEVTVTDETMVVMGVSCIIVRDQVRVDDELVEDTYDWFAQDKEGNVWYFGEDSRELEDDEVVSTEGSWEAGVDGALPGIVMYAVPVIGNPYRQEYYEGEAEDMAQVLSLNETIKIGLGTYDGCLQSEEWTPLEPGITEHKSYSHGIGLILEEVVEGGRGRLELVEYRPP